LAKGLVDVGVATIEVLGIDAGVQVIEDARGAELLAPFLRVDFPKCF
jgi:hypothetical protein